MLALEPLAWLQMSETVRPRCPSAGGEHAADELVVVVKADRAGIRPDQGPQTPLVCRTNGGALQCDPGHIGKGGGIEEEARRRSRELKGGLWASRICSMVTLASTTTSPGDSASIDARSPVPMGLIDA